MTSFNKNGKQYNIITSEGLRTSTTVANISSLMPSMTSGPDFSYTFEGNLTILKNEYEPVKIIFNGPATIVFWNDGTKTVVKCSENEPGYSEYTAVAYALAKKVFGNMSRFKRIIETVGEDKTKSVIHLMERLD